MATWSPSISPEAQNVLSHFLANSDHVGVAAEKLAEEFVTLVKQLDEAEARLAKTAKSVSRGYVRRKLEPASA